MENKLTCGIKKKDYRKTEAENEVKEQKVIVEEKQE